MRMKVLPLMLIGVAGIALPMGATAAGPSRCASGTCRVTPPNAWAQLRPGLGTTTPLAVPRATQGAVLQRVTMVTPPAPSSDPEIDQGEPTITCAGPEITARYAAPGGGKVVLAIGTSEKISPGCGPGIGVRYACTTTHLRGITGPALACRGPHGRRGLSWSGPSWGYWLDAPAGFPIAAMAASTR